LANDSAFNQSFLVLIKITCTPCNAQSTISATDQSWSNHSYV